jgi:hypothetical protein
MRRQAERSGLPVEQGTRPEGVVIEARPAAPSRDDGEAAAQLVEDVQKIVCISRRKDLERRSVEWLYGEEGVTNEHRDTIAVLGACDARLRLGDEDERPQRGRHPRAAEPRPELTACRRGGRSIEEEAEAEEEPVFRPQGDHVWRSDRPADPAE